VHATVREPAVAGQFYPAGARELGSLVERLLGGVVPGPRRPKAVIVPHAGFVYSGSIAATAFAQIAPFASELERIVLVGPAHRVYVDRPVSPGVDLLRTPLGELAVDVEALRAAAVPSYPAAHAREHSLEVELPFIAKLAPQARIVPLVVTEAAPAEIARTLELLWGGPETLIVISSDLSHYLPYREGRAFDERTATKILAGEPTLVGDEACGCAAINGLLATGRVRGELVDLRSSGDTAGTRDQVVGYGAFEFFE
jgi:MEMO1 family protein